MLHAKDRFVIPFDALELYSLTFSSFGMLKCLICLLIGAIESGARLPQSLFKGRPGLGPRARSVCRASHPRRRLLLSCASRLIRLRPSIGSESRRAIFKLVDRFLPGFPLCIGAHPEGGLLLLDF